MQASTVTADQAQQMLVEGNRRFTTGAVEHPHQSAARRAEVFGGQNPFAVLLSCADSRVPPEVFFDLGIGDVFVIRNAGNLVDDTVLGSMEYAVERLVTPLVVVLGHTRCGAVTATVQGGEFPGHIGSIAEKILPAVEASKDLEGDAVLNATLANVFLMVETIQESEPILAQAVKHGRLKVVGAMYHLDTGEVTFL
jgi:carbonic anhydrase